MYISETVVNFLDRCEADFDIIAHRRSASSLQSARTAKVPMEALAKAVVLCGRDQFLVALVPASRRVDPYAVGALLRDFPPEIADEGDLPFLFRDCAYGAVPALGSAFGLATIVDDALLRARDVYFEGGDHEHLVHMKGGEFARLMIGQPHGRISA